MRAIEKTIAIWIVLIGLFIVSIPVGAVAAEGRTPSEILAEKATFSQLAPGERFLIVSETGNVSISLNPKNNRLAAAEIALAHTDSRQVLTAMSADTAVFEFESIGDGEIRLKCQNGYLTVSDTGEDLYYADQPALCSAWRVIDDNVLHNPHAVYTYYGKPYTNVCLEYYHGGDNFAPYRRMDDAAPSFFAFAFYRLGNSVPGEAVAEDALFRLPVFETSDVHGYLANVSGDEPQYMLAYIADKVADARGHGADTRKELAVLLDGGDIYQGNTLSSLLYGQSLSAAFDLMGYDAVTLGNHEFDWQVEHTVDADGTMPDYDFLSYAAENKVPVLISNLFQNGDRAAFAEDHIILEKTAVDRFGHELPVRIGVIGYAGDYGDSIRRDLFFDRGYAIQPDIDRLNALAEGLEASGQCDATILLAHEEPLPLAESLGEATAIDLVLGGHAHRIEHWTTAWGLTYMEPSCNGKAYAYAELTFDSRDGSPVFSGVRNARIRLSENRADKLTNTPQNAEELDQEVAALTEAVIEKASDILDSEVGFITEPVQRYAYLKGSGERATTCGNWMASILARAAGADVGFINSGGLRVDFELRSGEHSRTITLANLYDMFPFENNIYCYELTWEELLTALKYAMTQGGERLLSCMVGADCYFTDAGISAIVSAEGEVVYCDGVWQDGWRDKKLRVAVNNYIATTDRNTDNMPNPFVAWSGTPRLVSSGETDIDGAIRVLVSEAAAHDGHLSVDTAPHFINSAYAAASVSDP